MSEAQLDTPAAADPPIAPARRSGLLAGLLLVALTLAAYAPVWDAGFVWDDDANVTANLPLRDLDGLRALWLEPGATTQYYPLVYTSLWLEYAIVELDPLLYHVDNVLLHALSAVVFWRLLLLFGLGAGAWWAAAVFALHPVHVESVAWVTERKNVLSGVFYLASAFIYLKSATDLFGSPGVRERRIGRVASLALFLCALLSKSPTASLPAALLVVVWWQRGRLTWADVRPLVPFVVLGAPIGLLTASMEANVGDVLGFDWQPSVAERLLLAGRAVWFYAGKLALPWPLVFVYPRWELDAASLLQWLYPLAAIGLLAGLARRTDRLGRAPLAAALFFGGTLLPVLGLFEIYFFRFSFVADHWQYLASLGPIALVVSGGAQPLGPMQRRAIGAIVLLVLGALTAMQARSYVDRETLWRATLAHNPGAPMVHYNLGVELQNEGRLEEAAHHYRRTIELRPDDPHAYNNLANVRAAQGRPRETLDLLEEAVHVAPDYGRARWNLALQLEAMGRFADARPHFKVSIDLAVEQGEDADAITASRLYFARALMRDGKPARALRVLDALIADAPDSAPAHAARGRALLRLGRPRDAAAAFDAALAIDPENAAATLGAVEARRRLTATPGAGHSGPRD